MKKMLNSTRIISVFLAIIVAIMITMMFPSSADARTHGVCLTNKSRWNIYVYIQWTADRMYNRDGAEKCYYLKSGKSMQLLQRNSNYSLKIGFKNARGRYLVYRPATFWTTQPCKHKGLVFIDTKGGGFVFRQEK